MDREAMNQYVRERRRAGLARGICPNCQSRPVTTGFKSCVYCREKAKAYNEANYGIGGVKSIVKPPMPIMCPLCESIPTIFYWHHWDDSNRKIGMWLCPYCNHIVELEERGLVDKYRELKSSIIHEYTIQS